MSATPLPSYVDARKAFIQEASVSGTLALEKLARVAACVASKEGRVRADLFFSTDSAGRQRIRGKVSAELKLVCQRCLGPTDAQISEAIDLVLVSDEQTAQSLDKEFDPWICRDHKIVLADLIDEQLLLGMPIVSSHSSASCCAENYLAERPVDQEARETSGKQQASPFAVLADLKVK